MRSRHADPDGDKEQSVTSPATENLQARNAYVRYYARTNSFWAKAIRRIKRTLKGDFGA